MTRAKRERIAYDSHEIRRDVYKNVFKKSSSFIKYLDSTIQWHVRDCNEKILLEIGSNAWIGYIYYKNIIPKELHCINISQAELDLGLSFYKNNKVPFPVNFHLMDAHDLRFHNNKFDFVFGGAILHYLSIEKAITEICRVLKVDGEILFHEPFGANPISKIIRWFTPAARTKDEKPILIKDLSTISRYFDIEIFPSELTCVIPNTLSQIFFNKQIHRIDMAFYALDRVLSAFSLLHCMYRDGLIYGRKKIIAKR